MEIKAIIEKFLNLEDLRSQALFQEIKWPVVDRATAALVKEIGREQYNFFNGRITTSTTAEELRSLNVRWDEYIAYNEIRAAMWEKIDAVNKWVEENPYAPVPEGEFGDSILFSTEVDKRGRRYVPQSTID